VADLPGQRLVVELRQAPSPQGPLAGDAGARRPVRRDFTAEGPNRLWLADIERHEALPNPAVVKGHRRVLVAAGALKLRAA